MSKQIITVDIGIFNVKSIRKKYYTGNGCSHNRYTISEQIIVSCNKCNMVAKSSKSSAFEDDCSNLELMKDMFVETCMRFHPYH